MIRLAIVEDHEFYRLGLLSRIKSESGLSVALETGSAREFVKALEKGSPNVDVAVLDVNLPGPVNGMQLLAKSREMSPKTRVVMLSVHEETSIIEACKEAGARGYLTKSEATAETFIPAIRAVHSGGEYFNAIDRNKLGFHLLTEKEMEIVRLIVEGYGRKAMTDLLGISYSSVGSRHENLFRKLNVTSAQEVRIFYAQWLKLKGEAV